MDKQKQLLIQQQELVMHKYDTLPRVCQNTPSTEIGHAAVKMATEGDGVRWQGQGIPLHT